MPQKCKRLRSRRKEILSTERVCKDSGEGGTWARSLRTGQVERDRVEGRGFQWVEQPEQRQRCGGPGRPLLGSRRLSWPLQV